MNLFLNITSIVCGILYRNYVDALGIFLPGFMFCIHFYRKFLLYSSSIYFFKIDYFFPRNPIFSHKFFIFREISANFDMLVLNKRLPKKLFWHMLIFTCFFLKTILTERNERYVKGRGYFMCYRYALFISRHSMGAFVLLQS